MSLVGDGQTGMAPFGPLMSSAGRARVLHTPLYRNGLALVANSGLTSVLGVAYWSLVARSSTATIVGLNAALVSALVACSNMSQAGLGGGLASYLPSQGSGAARLVKRAFLATALLSVLLGSTFVLVAGRFSEAFSGLRSAPLALFFVASVAIWSIFGVQDNVLTGLRKAIWIPFENIGYSLVKLLLVLVIGSAFGSYGIFVSWTVPALLAIVPVSLLIFRSLLKDHHPVTAPMAPIMPFERFVVSDSLGMVFAQVSTTLLPVLVVARAGVTGGGLFYIPWMLAQSLDLLGINVGMSLTVEGARARHAVRPMLRRLLGQVVPVVAVAGLGMGVGAPVLLRLFGAEYASSSVTILRVLLIGCLFRAVNALALCASRAELAARRIVMLQALLAGIVPACAWWLMGPWGVAGAAVAWVLGQAITSVVAIRSMGWLVSEQHS